MTDDRSEKHIAEMDFSKYRNDSNPQIKINVGLAESLGKRKKSHNPKVPLGNLDFLSRQNDRLSAIQSH